MKQTRTLLRIKGVSDNISADVFETAFRNHIGSLVQTDYMGARDFAHHALSHQRLISLLESYDLICPDYTMMPMVPWLMDHRKQSGLNFSIIFICHSPGLYGLEFYLMKDLIRPGDIIVAPSNFAARVIRLLAPWLAPCLTIIPHPLSFQQPVSGTSQRGKTIVTLTRLVEDKLIHRQIDAMAIVVHKLGYTDLKMVIGGKLKAPGSPEPTSYARLLEYKIKQLNLSDHVSLAGEIRGKDKPAFFHDAFVSVNLSRTLEEAFPKASVEALGFGLPVIATRWNGFVETVGDAGILIDLNPDDYGRVDVNAEDLALAIIRLYEKPVSARLCLDRLKDYDLNQLKDRYRDAFQNSGCKGEVSIHQDEKPPLGLLDTLSFIKVFSRSRLLAHHDTWVRQYLSTMAAGQSTSKQTPDLFFRFFITEALKERLIPFYAHKPMPPVSDDILHVSEDDKEDSDFREAMRKCIALSTNTHSRKTVLTIFSKRPDPELLNEALLYFENHGGIPLRSYFLPYADFLSGNHTLVCDFYSHYFSRHSPVPGQADMLCLWARSARLCHQTKEAVRVITHWLALYDTEPESLVLRIEYLKLLIDQAHTPDSDIDRQLGIVDQLCFDRNLVHKLEIMTYAR